MSSLNVANHDNVFKNGKKRKKHNEENKTTKETDEVIKKVKKKKYLETTEIQQDIVEVTEKVKKKKKKDVKITENEQEINSIDITESSKIKKKVQELPTVSIAVPGSILDNAQSPEFRTYLAGQIARAACIYKIDEVCQVFLFILENIQFKCVFL